MHFSVRKKLNIYSLLLNFNTSCQNSFCLYFLSVIVVACSRVDFCCVPAIVELFIDGSGSSGEAACLAVKVFDVGAVADRVITGKCWADFMMMPVCPISGTLSCAE